ncbi:DNA topoisomerase I [Hygrophoropsis aurantiaca]|uniref:DNA topoisomerase I n=1 Tax=Hygrophoropsis aurantiaca TaxID=72124 RepID=A0ACB8ALW3_9AGAM|nr:DNA topoisomerase I [Hygrophoropsis aurantiaca]
MKRSNDRARERLLLFALRLIFTLFLPLFLTILHTALTQLANKLPGEMSSDVSMVSDDEQPLGAISSTNGTAKSIINGNGHLKVEPADSAMSEDDSPPLSTYSKATQSRKPNGIIKSEASSEDDDDVPLASSPAKPTKSATRSKPAAQSRKRGRPSKHVQSSDEEEEVPLASSPAKQTKSAAIRMPGASKATTKQVNGNGVVKSESDGESAAPLAKRKRASTGKTKAPPKKKVKMEDSEDEDDAPAPVKKPRKSKAKVKAESEAEASSGDEKPKKAKGKKAALKKSKDESGSPEKPKRKGKAKEEADEEEVYRWWEAQQANGDGEEKWQTLEHNGVIFPPPYEPLPSNVKMKYKGKSVDLPPEAEEVAGFYAAMIETDHAQDSTFNKNFFDDWLKVLKEYPPRNNVKITSFESCDFRPMYEHFEAEKAKKKALSTAEKKELKKQKDAVEEKYVTCVLDGRKEKVGNFRVEPPGLFRGRGDHPKKGALKFRVRPEDITINIGEGIPVPVPNMSGNWKQVVHDKTVTWLANWVENVNGNYKYVFLAAGSSLKGQSDMTKFEKARELKNHVDRIRQDYNADLRSKVMADRQRATTMYFIDRLALRAGNEKGEDEADTVGCCSLRCEHVTLEAPNFIIFDFLGKDSIRYYNRVSVEPQVFKNIRYFKENKEDSDNLFDRVNTSLLNKHLASYMKGLTAKVFRTYNASITFQQQLDENTPANASVQEKLNAYNQANRMVAILCNHQRSAPKTHEQSMGKMRDKLRSFKYDRMKLRHVLFSLDSKYKKKKLYADDESDLDDDWIEEHEDSLKKKEIERTEKKFAKDNEKLVAEGGKPHKDSVLQEKIEAVEADFNKLAKERGTQKATLKRERPVDKIEEAIQKLDDKIKTFKLQMDDREAGKEVALGTSKINYLDPRITAAWCKIHDVPIEKIFSKTLLVKFPWAMEVQDGWKF